MNLVVAAAGWWVGIAHIVVSLAIFVAEPQVVVAVYTRSSPVAAELKAVVHTSNLAGAHIGLTQLFVLHSAAVTGLVAHTGLVVHLAKIVQMHAVAAQPALELVLESR